MDTATHDASAYLAPELWRRPAKNVGSSYTTLREHEPNMHFQTVTVSGGVHRDGSYTYAILVVDDKSELEPFCIVAEWPILAVDVATVDTISNLVAKASHYTARSILDPKGER